MKSILQDWKVCYLTKKPDEDNIFGKLDKHHIYFGSGDRSVSEQYGFWVWIRHDHHIADMPYNTPHNDRAVDLQLKRECQRKYEEKHTRDEFMALIGRNYL